MPPVKKRNIPDGLCGRKTIHKVENNRGCDCEVAAPGEKAKEPWLDPHCRAMKGRNAERKMMHIEGKTLDPYLGSHWQG